MTARSFLLMTAGIVAAFPMSAAQAQESGATLVLDPIIVTARRKEEALSKTPVAVTAVEADDLGAEPNKSLEQSVLRAPNVQFNAQGGPLSIRGVTSLGIAGGVDRQPAVGLFLDGVYLARPTAFPEFIEDVQRVEVLRGSQSTRYGKNTIGGAVNLVTEDPSDFAEGELSLGISQDGGRNARLSYSAPISDSFALRGVLAWRNSDGYIRNTANDKDVSDFDTAAGRLVLQGQLASGTDLRLSLDYTKDNSDGGLWYAPVDEALDFRATHDFIPEHALEYGGLTLRLEHEFEQVTLTSITAYRGHTLDFFLDGDFTATPYLVQGQVEDQRQFSQELRLSSNGDQPLDWSLGAYYLYEDYEAAQFFDLASVSRDLLSRNTFDQRNNSFALYGDVDWELTSDLTLAAGLRYTYDKKSTRSEISSPSGTFFFGAPGLGDEEVSFNDFSPEVTLSWQPTEQSLWFAKLSRGFKSGGISPYIEADGSANSYDPEETRSAEIGYRFTSADNRYSFAANAFYTKWRDQQVVIYTTPVTRVYRNAARSSAKGIELEASAQLNDNLTLLGSYGYTDGSYDDFVDSILGADYSGNPLTFSPEHSAHIGLRWDQDLANGLAFGAALDVTYRDSFSFTPDNAYRQEATQIVDARLSLSGDLWTATLFAKNLTDERYLTNYFSFFGADTGVAAPGRVIGLELSRKF